MKFTEESTVDIRDRILNKWRSLDPVEQSMHIITNSWEYRMAQYAEHTAIEEQEYYINSNGDLTTWSLDPTVQHIKLSEFLRKPKSSNLVADKLI